MTTPIPCHSTPVSPFPTAWNKRPATPTRSPRRRNFLHFPPESATLLTPFRRETLNQVYWSAEDLSPDPVVSARVTVHLPPSGDEPERLNLFIEVDTDWHGVAGHDGTDNDNH